MYDQETQYTKVTLGDCLLGAVNLLKNTNLDQNGYSGYGIGFDARSQFRYQVMRRVKALFFLTNMLSVHNYNRKKTS